MHDGVVNVLGEVAGEGLGTGLDLAGQELLED